MSDLVEAGWLVRVRLPTPGRSCSKKQNRSGDTLALQVENLVRSPCSTCYVERRKTNDPLTGRGYGRSVGRKREQEAGRQSYGGPATSR